MIAAVTRPPVDWFSISPSLILLVAAGACLMVAVLVPQAARRVTAAAVAAGGFVGALIAAILLYDRTPVGLSVYEDTVRRDRFFALAAIILAVVGLVAVLVSYTEHRHGHVAEYYALLATAGAGMMFLTQANSLLTLFLGLEWFSISLYILCAIDYRRERSLEAGLKYLVIGGFGSAVLLFGSALVYGATGKLTFDGIADAVNAGGLSGDALLLTGLAMIIVGLGFKASAAPFHMWTPDVYEGAPTPVTAFFAAAPKVAGIAMFVRAAVMAFPGITSQWQQIVVFVSIASMALGSFAAIGQRNFKRLMAYSSIGHMGFALVGLAAGTSEGVQGVLVYIAIYVTMTLGVFAVILSMRRTTGMVESIDQLAGLARTHPTMAFFLAMLLFSMAGVPPLAGFFAKFYVFLAAIKAGLYLLAVLGVVTSVVGAYYYLAIVKLMYFDEPVGTFEQMPYELRVVLAICGLFNIFFFLYPGPLVGIASAAAHSLF